MTKITQKQLFNYLLEHPDEEIDLDDLANFCKSSSKENTDKNNTNKSVSEVYSKEQIIKENKAYSEMFDKLVYPSEPRHRDKYVIPDNSVKQFKFMCFMKTDKMVLEKIRALEIYTLLVGKTKKPALNNKIDFETAVKLLDDEISSYELTNKIIKEEGIIYNAIPNKIEKTINDIKNIKEKYVNKCKLLNKDVKGIDEIVNLYNEYETWKLEKIEIDLLHLELRLYRLYNEYYKLGFEKWLLSRLKVSNKIIDRDKKIKSEDYILDYLERFKIFVNEIFQTSGCSDAPSEVKLLYVLALAKNSSNLSNSEFKMFNTRRNKSRGIPNFSIEHAKVLLPLFKKNGEVCGNNMLKYYLEKLEGLDRTINYYSDLFLKLKIPVFNISSSRTPSGFCIVEKEFLSCYEILTFAKKELAYIIDYYHEQLMLRELSKQGLTFEDLKNKWKECLEIKNK